MRLLFPLVLLLHGCAASRDHMYDIDFPSDPSGEALEEDSDLPIQQVILRSGNCPNWKAALDKALAAAGCPGVTPSPSASACKKLLPCDVCKILEDGAWPTAFIVDFPMGKLTTKGAVKWEPVEGTPPDATRGRPHRDVPGAIPSGSMQLKRSLCHGPLNVNELAHAMFHESLHLCKAYGAYGPTTEDLPFWDPRDDADAVTKKCGL